MTNTPETKVASSTLELLATGKALGTPIVQPGYSPVIIVPSDWKAEPLTPAPLLDHIRQRVTLLDAASFADYVKRYVCGDTVLFAKAGNATGSGAEFRAVLDYHSYGAPARCAHVAVFSPVLTVEWQEWQAINGRPMSQTDFINFIERHAPDIVEPDGASLMEFTANFEAKTDVTFGTRVDRVTGGLCIAYKEEVTAGSMKDGVLKNIPARLRLAVSVFEGGGVAELEARLEWKPRDGKLTVTVHLLRAHLVARVALDALKAEIEKATDMRALTGQPTEDSRGGSW